MNKHLADPTSASRPSRLKTRLSVASRAVAALAGGYVFASLAAAALALSLPLPREEAILAGGMAAFVGYPAAAIWAFLASSARRAWLGLLVPGALMGAAVWFVRGGLS